MQIKDSYIYPHINDDLFNIKIAKKQEFQDSKDDKIKDVTSYANEICNQNFELRPHQIFVKNFLSSDTPYNSLLLYHGLGTGKTCSAISIAEDMRKYTKDMNSVQKILIVASPNVQDNFKKQIFNENNLIESKNNPGTYTLDTCIGNDLLAEINPTKRHIDRSSIINEANRIINKHYEFMGYTKLSYLIDNQMEKNNLSQTFDGRLIIIDEVHNIRSNEDDENKRIVKSLYKLVENTEHVRFLFLSATPMYNNYREILWLINLMNMNDNRSILKEKDVFDTDDNFLLDDKGIEIGKMNFIRKITGYVSFVRGENPYSFPYRIYPNLFDRSKSSLNMNYPRIQYNGEPILEPIKHLDIYMTELYGYQLQLYKYVSKMLGKKQNTNTDEVNVFDLENKGYLRFQRPLNVLNIAFPNSSIKELASTYDFQNVSISELLGKTGLQNIITDINSLPYIYKTEYLENKKSIFNESRLQNYSSKIHSIVESVTTSSGIHLVYSQFIYGGIIPIVCALEERGYSNFKTEKQFVDPKYKSNAKIQLKKEKYIIITGNQQISGNIKDEINEATSEANKNGEIIKVILISKAGSEGIDFKNIRNVHILEPWYNMNRLEQIIGRAVRSCSHKHLNFKNRNVNIYMYGTVFSSNGEHEDNSEAIDMYVYRSAEIKAKKIGIVSRVLKETSIDCLLQRNNQHMPEVKMNQIVKQHLSNSKIIDYPVGDKPYSSTCDYMSNCEFKCKAVYNNEIADIDTILNEENIDIQKKSYDTFRNSHLQNNIISLKSKIKSLFVDRYVYTKEDVTNFVNYSNTYHPLQIQLALRQLSSDKLDIVVDKYDRKGYIIEIDDTYFFQPFKIGNKKISMEHRSTPLFQTRRFIPIKLNKPIQNNKDTDKSLLMSASEIFNVSKFNSDYQIFLKEHEWNNYIRKSVLDKSENMIKQHYTDYLKVIDDDYKLEEYIMNQYLDKMAYNDFVNLCKYYYNNKNSELNSYSVKYIQNNFFQSKFYDGFIGNNGQEIEIFVYDKSKESWEQNNSIYNQLQEEIDSVYKLSKSTSQIGYYLPNKSNKMNFKMKNTDKSQKRSSSGAICRNLDNIYIQQFLDDILKHLTTQQEDEIRELLKINSKITNNNLCNIIEILLRFYESKRLKNKVWFITPLQALFNKQFHKIRV